MSDVDTTRAVPPPTAPGRRTWARHRTPLIVLITASTLLVGSVTAVAATGGFSRSSTGAAPWSQGMMGGGITSRSGMMNGSPASAAMGPVLLAGDGTAVTSVAAARQRAAHAATNVNLHPGEVIWFDNGFYVELKDASGQSATEVIVDPRTGAVTTEPGPAMMWNTRYGMMRGTGAMMGGGPGMMGGGPGMMGGGGAASSGQTATVTADQSRSIAQQWLDANRSGQSAQTPDSYPGYYTMETTTSGKITGMLAVNATTGAVWYHNWHGHFIVREDS
jgi:hypothetical protein